MVVKTSRRSLNTNDLIRHFGYIWKRAISRTIASWYQQFEESPGSIGQAAR